jgi:hypothetical protein
MGPVYAAFMADAGHAVTLWPDHAEAMAFKGLGTSSMLLDQHRGLLLVFRQQTDSLLFVMRKKSVPWLMQNVSSSHDEVGCET